MRSLLRMIAVVSALSSCAMLATNTQSQRADPGTPKRHVARLPQVDPATIGPGTVIELEDGEYQEALVLPFQGTAEKPVVIKAAAGARPTFRQSVLIAGAAYLRLEGIEITRSEAPGIAIRQGSHHITVSACTVERSALGIWITEGAGGGHRIADNTIRDNKTHGIAIDRVNAKKGDETIITGNKISGNGHHGIEVNGSWYIVEGNEVHDNGAAVPGTSGIHVFAKDAVEDAGDHNVIRRNVTYRNREADGPDGNGIQIDQWCDHNEVYYNIAYENDGAGICLFDAGHAMVYNNTLFSNGRNPNKNRPYRAELLLAGDARVNLTREALVVNNIVLATGGNVHPLLVDKQTAANPLSIHHNLFFDAAGGSLFSWAGRAGGNPEELTRVSSKKAHDNIAADPLFTARAPSRPADFGLQQGSKAIGSGSQEVRPQGPDVLGNRVSSARPPDLGAVQRTP